MICKCDGIVCCLFVWLQVPRIGIASQIITKRKANRNISVGIFQFEEIIAANPSPFIHILSVRCIHEHLRHHTVDVVNVELLPPTHQHAVVGD